MGQTFRGALGLSFAAGSTEDSTPNPNLGLREGITTQNIKIPERALQNIGAWAVSQFKDIPVDESVETVGGHLPKPILFGVGKGGLTPKILPLQILRIGQLVIVGVPAEITTMAGRRLRATVLGELSSIGVKHLAITAYANDYSQYITTKEEYDMQHYEGASTLFGPRTLLAYQQEFRKLAIALGNGRPVNPGPTPPGNSSPTYRRLTFRNLSTEEIQLYYYKWYESEYEFLRGKKGAGAPSEDGIITIPANGEVAIPETQF
jgi:neutral ceramidase